MPLVRRSVFSLHPRGAGASSMARPLGRIRPATQAADRQPLVRARLHLLRTKISLSPDKKRERNHRQHKEYPAENEPTATSDGISRIVANIVTQAANQKAPATECTQPKCQKPTKNELTRRKKTCSVMAIIQAVAEYLPCGPQTSVECFPEIACRHAGYTVVELSR